MCTGWTLKLINLSYILMTTYEDTDNEQNEIKKKRWGFLMLHFVAFYILLIVRILAALMEGLFEKLSFNAH